MPSASATKRDSCRARGASSGRIPNTRPTTGFSRRIVRETGGRLLHARQNREIASTFGRVIDEFNNRYVLGYVPTGVTGSGWHEVAVRLKKRQGTILARRGYFAN